MPLFRKKPVVVEARQVLREDAPGIELWSNRNAYVVNNRDDWWMYVRTLEGGHVAKPGD